jgi:uncharacterized membrane protein
MSDDPQLQRLEHQIGRLLRAGVLVSATALAAGLALAAVAGGHGSKPLLNAGLLLLIAIPITRIIASFIDAVRRRDTLLTWSTAAVLAVLTLLVIYSTYGR